MQQDWRKSHLGLYALLAVLLTLGTLLQDFRFHRSLTGERTALSGVEREIGSLHVALADLRAAQAGYVAVGQGPEFWMGRAAELSARIEGGLVRLRESSSSPAARVRYDAALALLANLTGFDQQARDHVLNDQRFLAADVVFVDTLDVTQRLAGELDAVRAAEVAAAEARILGLTQLRFALNAAAMGLLLVAAVLIGRPARPSAASQAATMAQMIRELPPAVKPAAPAARPVPGPPAPLPVPVVNLPEAAELCVDLARVIDSRDVPALLERTARVLDAKGIILWIVDAAGSTLRPSLTHGYPDKVLGRLGVLEVDADNVTSLAFRSMRPQVMSGAAPDAAGAVAVPLMTAAGCSGVLAAEIRASRPAPELLAITRIFAAQFATLVAPDAHADASRIAEA